MTWGTLSGGRVRVTCDHPNCKNYDYGRIPLGTGPPRFLLPGGWVVTLQPDPEDQRSQQHACPEHARG